MQYLLLISADEELAVTAMREAAVRHVRRLDDRPGAARRAARRTRACTRARPRRPCGCATARCCSPTARSPRGASRSAGSRIVDCADLDEAVAIAAAHPAAAFGQVEIRPVRVCDRRRRAGARGHVPQRLGTRRRHADPAHRRLGPGRGVHPGGVRRRAAHLAPRRRPATCRARGSPRPRATAPSTGSGATRVGAAKLRDAGRSPERRRARPRRDGQRDRRRPPAADLHVLPPGAGASRRR